MLFLNSGELIRNSINENLLLILDFKFTKKTTVKVCNIFFILLPSHNLEIQVEQAVIFAKFNFIHCYNKFLKKTKKQKKQIYFC